MNLDSRPMEPAQEQTLWAGGPSQWMNFGSFFMGGALMAAGGYTALAWPEIRTFALAFAALVFLVVFWKWLVVRSTELVLTNQRLTLRHGVLSRRRHDLELYRVKDTALHEPLFLRMVSLANIEITSSDRSHPLFVLSAIRDAEPLRQMVRAHVESLRARKGVREVDME